MSDYDTDFYAWTQAQAAAIRAGAWDDIDRAHLAEEIEDMGASQCHAGEGAQPSRGGVPLAGAERTTVVEGRPPPGVALANVIARSRWLITRKPHSAGGKSWAEEQRQYER